MFHIILIKRKTINYEESNYFIDQFTVCSAPGRVAGVAFNVMSVRSGAGFARMTFGSIGCGCEGSGRTGLMSLTPFTVG